MVLDLWLATPFGPNQPKTSFQVPESSFKFHFNILAFYQIPLWTRDKMKPCLSKLEVGFSAYGLVSLLGPIGPKVVLRPQAPGLRFILIFQELIQIFLWVVDKIRSCFLKLKVEFLTYGSISPLGPIGPKVVPPGLRSILIFQEVIRFSSGLWIK